MVKKTVQLNFMVVSFANVLLVRVGRSGFATLTLQEAEQWVRLSPHYSILSFVRSGHRDYP